ncbi:Retrovirus-related Pol polyprotein from transposon 17.6 [Dictyocoela muelleri]|nr:Retrovirus-related Pol polyprotein from transposon 17.6 [Dictyocoela muelleri]
MLSVYKSLQNFRNIILSSKIVVYTDNKNIIYNSNDPIKRIERWKMTLQEFDYLMKYYQEILNCGAYALYRMFKIGIPQTQDKHHNIMHKFLKNGKINEFGKFKLDKKKKIKHFYIYIYSWKKIAFGTPYKTLLKGKKHNNHLFNTFINLKNMVNLFKNIFFCFRLNLYSQIYCILDFFLCSKNII